MGLISNLLGLVGIGGNTNSTVGLQVLGTGTVDLTSTNPVTIFTPPSGNTMQIVAVCATVRDPDGYMSSQGYPQMNISVGGIQAAQVPAVSNALNAGAPFYDLAALFGPSLPLGTNTVITAQMFTTATTGSVKVDVWGYAITP